MRLIPRPYQANLPSPGGLGVAQTPQHAAEAWPGQNRRIRGCETSKRGEVETVLAEMCHRLLCSGRPDPGQQLENPEAGEGITRVFCPAQDRQQILDMSGLDKLQPAIFDEWDVTARQLDLQPGAMVRGTEQYGLVAQIDPGLALLQDLVRDIDCLRHLVFDGHQMG